MTEALDPADAATTRPGAPFPTALAAITCEWLTAAVGGTAALGPRVTHFAAEPVGVGVGFVGVVYRLRLGYETSSAAAPASVIVKMPSSDVGAREMANTFGHYEKEVGFYRDLADANPMRSPRAFHCAFDAGTGQFNLVLEDFAWAQVGDQLAGFTIDQAAIAVEALARMQASWWQAPRLDAFEWLRPTDDPKLLAMQGAFQRCWSPFRAFFGDELPETLAGVGERLANRIADLMRALAKRPPTLVHGDYRADNFLYGGAAAPFVVVDWQIVRKGLGVHDLAFLLVSSLTIEDRRVAEEKLLRLYLDTLRACGVEGYDPATAWNDYRISVLAGWLWPVIGAGSLDTGSARGAAMFRQWHRRAAAAIDDLDAAKAVWALLK